MLIALTVDKDVSKVFTAGFKTPLGMPPQTWGLVVADPTIHFPQHFLVYLRYHTLVKLKHRMSSTVLVGRKQGVDKLFQNS